MVLEDVNKAGVLLDVASSAIVMLDVLAADVVMVVVVVISPANNEVAASAVEREVVTATHAPPSGPV